MNAFPSSARFLAGLLLVVGLSAVGCGPAPDNTVGSAPLPAPEEQLSFKDLVKAGEAAEKSNRTAEAADYFARAAALKPRRQDLHYRAGELFSRVRNYRRAADSYQFVTDASDYPLLGLSYGRALKQDGRYERARSQLAAFLESYNGTDRPIVAEIVRNELAGIALVQERAGQPLTVGLDRPGRGINTAANESGPIALGGDELYFTSESGGQGRLYRSQLRGREWDKAAVPPGFPVIAQGEFGSGSMSADGRTFYFTICSGTETAQERIGRVRGRVQRCEIFRGTRSAAGRWDAPEALGPQINLEGANNAYPFATRTANEELLFFASDREGGRGGLDLYVSSRPLNSNVSEFSPPANLGPTINTVSDELSPSYLPEQLTLYFASNGHPSYGGLDVFRSSGQASNWSQPTNVGAPINSTADDFGLSRNADGSVGYLASNRAYPGFKETTTDSDIFRLNFRGRGPRLKATAYDNTSGSELGGISVQLIAMEGGRTSGVDRQVVREFPGGVYDFDLQPSTTYRVVVGKSGFQSQEYRVVTDESGAGVYGQPVFLKRDGSTPPTTSPQRQPVTLPPSASPGTSQPGGAGSAATPPTSAPATAPPSTLEDAPRGASPPTAGGGPLPAVAYRIQISAERQFNPEAGRYESVRSLGNLSSEPVPGRSIRRITVGYYLEEAAAKEALETVQRRGFSDAFLVRYDNGVRYGRVRL